MLGRAFRKSPKTDSAADAAPAGDSAGSPDDHSPDHDALNDDSPDDDSPDDDGGAGPDPWAVPRGGAEPGDGAGPGGSAEPDPWAAPRGNAEPSNGTGPGGGSGRGERRRRIAVAAGTVAAIGVLAAIAVPVIGGSDAASTHLVQAAVTPPPLPLRPLPDSLGVRWSARSVQPGGSAVERDTVVVGGPNSLSGRDPLTGAERWSYRRGNARLCGWARQDGAVVAVFGKPHGCTELVALDAGTGARRWYRSADLGGEATLTGAAGVVVVRSGDRLHAVDTVTGLNRWTARKPGCQYGPLVVDQLGAVAVLHCAGGQDRVIGHDAYAETEHWNVPAPGAEATVVAVGEATAVLSVVAGAPTLTRYDQRGKLLDSFADPRLAASGSGAPTGVTSGATTLIWTGTAVLAVRLGTHAVSWSAPALGPPTLDGDTALVAQPGGFVRLAVSDGGVLGRTAVAGRAPGRAEVLARIGALIVGSGPDTVTVYG